MTNQTKAADPVLPPLPKPPVKMQQPYSEMAPIEYGRACYEKGRADLIAELRPVAYEVRAYGRTQGLVVRADVADEKACKMRETYGADADVTVRPLSTIPEK